MGAQRLSNRRIRSLRKATGLDITRAWAYGGYEYHFITRDHKHGSFNIKTSECRLRDELNNVVHFNTCFDSSGFLLETILEFGKDNE